MEVYNLVLIISAILPPAIITMAENLLKNKLLKCLRVMKVLDIGILIPATIPQVIVEFVKVVDICLKMPDTLP